jgi:hypothetical protein
MSQLLNFLDRLITSPALRVAAVVAVLAVLLDQVARGGFERVEPGTVGVRVRHWGGGLQRADLDPGLYWDLPGTCRWFHIPTTTRFASFGLPGAAAGPLEIRTADENPARLKLIVPYRIDAGSAWRLVDSGLLAEVEERMQDVVEDVLRQQFGSLASEEWFDAGARQELVERSLPVLRNACASLHTVPERILLHEVGFSKEFETNLQKKQLAFQKERRAEAEGQVAGVRSSLDLEKKRTEAQAASIRAGVHKQMAELRAVEELALAEIGARAATYAIQTRATADVAYAGAIAEGQLAVENARAGSERLRLGALNSEGGRLLLAREAAQSFRFGKVVLDSNRPDVPLILDVDSLVKLLTPGS